MPASELESAPPFDWSEADVAFVTSEIGREFPAVALALVTQAVETARRRIAASEGRVSLTKMTRQILRSGKH